MNQQFVDKITQKIPELKLFFDEPMKTATFELEERQNAA